MGRLIKNNILLYHGTTLSSFKQILKDGHISTRESLHRQANFDIESVIQYNSVYFSSNFNYCKMFAESEAIKMSDYPIILQTLINEDTHKLLADEDIIQYFWYGNDANDIEAILSDLIIIKNKGPISYNGKHRFVYDNNVDVNNYKNYAYTINDIQYKNLVHWYTVLINCNVKIENILTDSKVRDLFNNTFSYKDSLRDISSVAVLGNVSTSVIKSVYVGTNNNTNSYDYEHFTNGEFNKIYKAVGE